MKNFRWRLLIWMMGGILSGASSMAQSVRLLSPDGGTGFYVYTSGDALFYKIEAHHRQRVLASSLGLEVNGRPLATPRSLKIIKRYSHKERYRILGGHDMARDRCNGYILRFDGAKEPFFDLEVRVFDDGVAFRYLVSQAGRNLVTKERSSFHLPAGSVLWYQTDTAYYEGEYRAGLIDSLQPGLCMGPPATIRYPDGGYAAISEGGLTDFSGLQLEKGEGNILTAKLAGSPVLTGFFATPWRVISLARTLDQLVNNDIITAVSPSSEKKLFPEGSSTDWIRPGRCVWSWLAGNGPVTVENMKRFSKWASQLGWEYNLVDEGWGSWKDTITHRDQWDLLKELVEYSDSLHVRVWVWKAYPDRKGVVGLKDSAQRVAFFQKCHDLGIAGLKIDFFDSERQEIIQFYQAALRDAARFHLMIDFHGADKPSGESRTWPNQLTREAIRGLEYDGPHATQNTIAPFTRFLAGAADYTPLQLGRLKGERSLAHHIASAITFTSPLLCLALNPEELLQSPYRDLITGIPATWDETRVLSPSTIGKLSVFARRKGNKWYLAVLNNDQPKTITIDLSFLPNGEFDCRSLKDDLNRRSEGTIVNRKVANDQKIKVELAASGGYIAVLSVRR